jgi:hypothetical protein
VPMPFEPGNLTCNWWGAAGAPANVSGDIPVGAYTPTAPEAIAGRSSVECDPTPVAPPSVHAATRVCAADGSAATYATLAHAVAATAVGGTVRICAGEHLVSDVTLTSAITIEAEAGAEVTLRGNNETVGLLVRHAEGTVAVRGLRFTDHRFHAVNASGTYGDVVVEDSRFVTPAGQQAAIVFGSNTNAGAKAVVRRINATGGMIGVLGSGARDVDIEDSHFSSHTHANIQFQSVAKGRMLRNTVEECAANCIRVAVSGDVVVAENVMRTTPRVAELSGTAFAPGVQWGIYADAATILVEGNSITGLGSVGNRGERNDYPIRNGGIFVTANPGAGTGATLRSNSVTNVARGIVSQGRGARTAHAEGSDNVVEFVMAAVASDSGGTAALHRNNFSDYIAPVAVAGVAAGVNPLGTGSLTCNWWGRSDGPAVMDGPWSAVSPYASTPIAGNAGVNCTPSAPMVPVQNVRVCADGGLPVSGTTFRSLASGLEAAGPGSVVQLCGGQHPVTTAVLTQPLTLEPETGAEATIVGDGTTHTLLVRHPSGTTTIRGLRFSSTGVHAINAGGAYGNLVVEDAVFALPASAQAAVFVGASSVPNATATIRRIEVSGGQMGVFIAGDNVTGNARAEVSDSRFSTHAVTGVQVQGLADAVIRGNMVEECGSVGCIRVRAAGTVEVLGNTLRTTKRAAAFPAGGGWAAGVRMALVADATSILVQDNIVEGLGSYDVSNPDDYPIGDGIVVSAFVRPTQATVRRNTVRHAARGLASVNEGNPLQQAHMHGHDNRIENVHTAVFSRRSGTVVVGRTDFGSFVVPIAVLEATAEVPMPFGAGNLACNWWGAPGTPIVAANIPEGVYTPAAGEPIAGNGGVSCDPTPMYSTVRVCASGTGDSPTYRTLAGALGATADGGTVSLCAGTHSTSALRIDRAMTLQAEAGATAIIDGTGSPSNTNLVNVRHGSGIVTIRNLQFSNWTRAAVSIESGYASALVEDASFAGAAGSLAGVMVSTTPVEGATVTLRRVTTTGGSYGVWASGSPHLEVTESRMDEHGIANAHVQSLGNATFQQNSFNECGNQACIRVAGGGQVVLANNTITTTGRGGNVHQAIVANAIDILVLRNTIQGVGTVTNPADRNQYPIRNVAIQVLNPPSRRTSASVVGNTVRNAATGIVVNATLDNGNGSHASGMNNVFDGVQTAVTVRNGGTIRLNRNDFLNYDWGVHFDRPAGTSFVLDGGSLTCNWWGSPFVPDRINNLVPYGAYMANAQERIANRISVGCDPAPAPLPATAFVCADGSFQPGVASFRSIQQAIHTVTPDGTVGLCGGTHFATNINVNKPITLQPAGAGTPIINSGGSGSGLLIDNFGPGVVTVRGIRLENAQWNNIGIHGSFDRVVLEDMEFFPPADPNPQFDSWLNVYRGYLAGVVVGNAPQGTLTVRNSSFTGGDIGVNTWSFTGEVLVEGSTFNGLGNASVHLGGGARGLITGNTVTNCGPSWCLGLFEAGESTVSNNTITVDISRATNNAIQSYQTQATIIGNTIVATGGTMDPNSRPSWAIRNAGIDASWATGVRIDNNRVSGAWHGISTWNASGSGTGNVITTASTAVHAGTERGDTFTFRFNDITGYANPFNGAAFTSVNGSLTCNWWGSAAGPSNVMNWVPQAVYSPWATAPTTTGGLPTCS